MGFSKLFIQTGERLIKHYMRFILEGKTFHIPQKFGEGDDVVISFISLK